jgi:hypothetical protein
VTALPITLKEVVSVTFDDLSRFGLYTQAEMMDMKT